MKKTIGLATAVVLAFGIAAAAFGAEPGDKHQVQTKTGVVKKVDADAKKIVVMVARELTFAVTDATKIAQGDAAKTLADIKEGATVTVVYSFEGKDNRVASKITLAAPAPDKEPAPDKK